MNATNRLNLTIRRTRQSVRSHVSTGSLARRQVAGGYTGGQGPISLIRHDDTQPKGAPVSGSPAL